VRTGALGLSAQDRFDLISIRRFVDNDKAMNGATNWRLIPQETVRWELELFRRLGSEAGDQECSHDQSRDQEP